MLHIVLFITFAFANESLVFTALTDDNGDAVGFIAIEFGKCYYYKNNASGYFTHDGDKIKVKLYENSSSCSGVGIEQTTNVNDDNLKNYCEDANSCSVEIKQPPKYIGSHSIVDDDENCTHSDNTIRAYYTDKCYRCNKNNGQYCNYIHESGYVWESVYPNNKCELDERISRTPQWKCDVCNDGFIFQCGEMSTFVIPVLILLSFFL
ncbi:hypothetical protein EDI_008140 [Entamoeba dispar SAW760]|uniref:Uncharacterized protein n=1 Tax=Entamoeba dispar (strain ATCC PRA-260 / SAW760) TaxID=370354 RepID=B0E6F7_ENTDS|nr:uncharacterized protein EDI_008140 [Entamoeba dispar SAW760]EDR29892.1 hypothetical protein EDI_008140 [Entamoeba dispar SAW760]|eukprot:EDR29892.1 hypothetical protein EDI_008140 [Entamoeba dispar SAW760]